MAVEHVTQLRQRTVVINDEVVSRKIVLAEGDLEQYSDSYRAYLAAKRDLDKLVPVDTQEDEPYTVVVAEAFAYDVIPKINKPRKATKESVTHARKKIDLPAK